MTEGAEADNIAARLDASSEGNSSGKFIASDPISMAPEGDTELLLYYPYRDKVILKEETTTMDSELTSSQEQMTSGDSRHLGRYTLAYASAIMRNEEDLVQFHMKHAMAYVRILVSSNELLDVNFVEQCFVIRTMVRRFQVPIQLIWLRGM